MIKSLVPWYQFERGMEIDMPKRMTGKELFELNRGTPLDRATIDAVRQFPVARVLEHCGAQFEVSPFEIYAICPSCGTKIKARSFGGVPELEDVFDAVFEWLLTRDAQVACCRRQGQINSDLESDEPIKGVE
jgi:hypothetical protein